jgi:PHD and RING finger domain-containing protein 1
LSDDNGEQSERCPICLCSFATEEIATPTTCSHSFCVGCLLQWSVVSNVLYLNGSKREYLVKL